MNRVASSVLIIITFAIYLSIAILNNLKTERNFVQIEHSDSNVASISFTLAVLGDLHLSEGSNIKDFQELLEEVKSNKPDLVLFVGDYVTSPRFIKDIDSHRTNIINTFKVLDTIPRAIVLGNHENWTNGDAWKSEFKRLGVDALENEVRLMDVKGVRVCIRGLGDKWSHKFSYVDYPSECLSLPKITITHDPQGAFEKGVEGLVFAGHTHCGQVSFPLVGALKVPSKAPTEATCGLYKDDKRTLFVTSGVGTSLLPIRIGTKSQWDLIDLSF